MLQVCLALQWHHLALQVRGSNWLLPATHFEADDTVGAIFSVQSNLGADVVDGDEDGEIASSRVHFCVETPSSPFRALLCLLHSLTPLFFFLVIKAACCT